MSLLPRTDLSQWGQHGTTGGPHASFFKRYADALARVARFHFGADPDLAADLVQGFLTDQLARTGPDAFGLKEVFDPERGRFRSLVYKAFRNHCSEPRRRERLARGGRDLDAIPEPALEEPVVERLMVRARINDVRAQTLERLRLQHAARPAHLALMERYLALRFPEDLEAPPLLEKEIAARLGVSDRALEEPRQELLRHLLAVIRRRLLEEGQDEAAAELDRRMCYRYMTEA